MCLMSKPASFMHWIAVARKVCCVIFCAIRIFGYICHECELIRFNRNVRVPDRFIFMFVEGRLCASRSIEETCRVMMCFTNEKQQVFYGALIPCTWNRIHSLLLQIFGRVDATLPILLFSFM